MVAVASLMKKLLPFACLSFVLSAHAVPNLTATTDHVLDGDTFAATVHLEDGAGVSARVRFINIDAPETNGECGSEIEWAKKSKNRLEELLPAGTKVILSDIKDDKYLGRIDARVKFPNGRDVGQIMIDENMAKAYNGGRRGRWCAPDEIKQWGRGNKK